MAIPNLMSVPIVKSYTQSKTLEILPTKYCAEYQARFNPDKTGINDMFERLNDLG